MFTCVIPQVPQGVIKAEAARANSLLEGAEDDADDAEVSVDRFHTCLLAPSLRQASSTGTDRPVIFRLRRQP